MPLETNQLKKLADLSPGLKIFMDFLSVQEVERMAEILDSVLSRVGQGRESKNADYKSWLVLAKDKVAKELTDSQELFGFNDLASRFPIDEFLQAYYDSTNGA